MNVQSPFLEVQRAQEEQREGCALETPKPAMSTCCTCGYSWQTGLTGSHICAEYMAMTISEKESKIAEQVAQIVALRMFAGKVRLADWKYLESAQLHEDATAALFTPAPPVVLLEDVTPLLDALKIIAANPGASHGPSCLYDSGPIATGAIAKFNVKHPQP